MHPLRELECTSELLILPDGQVLVHNLTPVFAQLLLELNPACDAIAARVAPNERVPRGKQETSTTDHSHS